MKTQIKKIGFLVTAITAFSFIVKSGNNTPPLVFSEYGKKEICKNDSIYCYCINNQVKLIREITTSKFISFYHNGNIEESGFWKNNHLVGAYKLYYPNGIIWHHFNYNENGKREGLQEYYSEDGRLIMSSIWKNGQIVGSVERYDKNGEKIIINSSIAQSIN